MVWTIEGFSAFEAYFLVEGLTRSLLMGVIEQLNTGSGVGILSRFASWELQEISNLSKEACFMF
jgi:hypothetical protein